MDHLALLLKLSETLVSTTDVAWPTVLSMTAGIASADTCYLIAMGREKHDARLIGAWRASGESGLRDSHVDLSPLDAVYRRLVAGESLIVSDLKTAGFEVALELASFVDPDTSATALIPCVRDGNALAVLGFEYREPRELESIAARLDLAGRHISAKLFQLRTSRALELERQQLIAIFDSLDHGIYVADIDTYEILFLNRAAKRRAGSNLVGGLCFRVLQGREQPCPFCTNEIIRRQPGEAYHWEYHNPVNGKDYFITNRLMTWPGGRLARFELDVDVTERKKLEREASRAARLESLGILAGGIAHDFNNILTGIVGNISLTKMEPQISDHAHELLDEASRAAFRARDLTNQLLTFSRGGSPVRNEITTLGELIEDSVSFCLRGSKAGYRIEIDDGLWGVKVDEAQINQVIQNIVINADQAMPNGGTVHVVARNVEIEHDQAGSLRAGRYIQLSICDEGKGIPEEHLDRVFDPFFSTKDTGTGLGLATAFSIVRRHDGLIDLFSRADRGTQVSVYLPATEAKMVDPVCEDAETPADLSGSVLVIDDEISVRRVLKELLERLSMDVVTAPDGAEGLRLFEKALTDYRPFNLVITDLTIPGGMGGVEFVRSLRAKDRDVPVLVSSGYATGPVLSDYESYGFSGRLQKPYRTEEVVTAIARVMQISEAYRG